LTRARRHGSPPAPRSLSGAGGEPCPPSKESAAFAGPAARQALRAADAYGIVLACELVTAVRALRMHPTPPPVPAFTVAAEALSSCTVDRPLPEGVSTATELLPVPAGL
jgi:histidine ammonia-lyase